LTVRIAGYIIILSNTNVTCNSSFIVSLKRRGRVHGSPVSMVEGYSYKLPPTQQPEQKTVVLFRNSLKL
jgi:hypothetical protein